MSGSAAKRALVLGAAGFVGRHMVAELEQRGWFLTVNDPAFDWSGGYGCIEQFASDTNVYDLVVHAAARAPHRAAIDGQPATTIYNRLLDAAMFEWAIRTGQRRMLYLSSCVVYPAFLQSGGPDGERGPIVETDLDLDDLCDAPPDAYGWSKLAGEQMARAATAAGVPTHVVRPFSGYGEDQSGDFPFGAFVARAARREDPFRIWGDGSQVRDWVHVSDVVNGALAVVEADVREPVNLCTGVGTSVANLAEAVCRAAGYKPTFRFDLTAPAGAAYRVGDPARMRELWVPRVTLADAIPAALDAAANR